MQAIDLCASYLGVLVRHPSLEMEAFGENQAFRREGKLCTAPPFHAYVGKRFATKLALARFVNPVLFSRLSYSGASAICTCDDTIILYCPLIL